MSQSNDMRLDFQLKLIVAKLHLDCPHHHQMPNQTVCHTKILWVISRRSNMTDERFAYKNVYSKVTK